MLKNISISLLTLISINAFAGTLKYDLQGSTLGQGEAVQATADDYSSKVPVFHATQTNGSIDDVVLLSSSQANGQILVTLGLKTSSQSWTQSTIMGVNEVLEQRSIDDALNPSDHYYELETSDAPGAGVGGGPTPNVSIQLSFTAPFGSMKLGGIHHLSFRQSMSGGSVPWRLYTLDLTKPEQPVLTYVKTYNYVQGQVQ